MDTTAIFRQHRDRLERVAARVTGDREDARDVVADAFASLLEQGPDDPDHAVAWLYVTVRNRARNRVRARVRAERRLVLLATDGVDQADVGPVRGDHRIRSLLAAGAAELSDRDRTVIAMRHVADADYGDIAAAIGTSHAQARVVVHRATTRLRRGVVDALGRRGQASVGDEVEALRQVPVLAPLARPVPALDAARDWWRRAQLASGRAAAWVSEALAPWAAVVAVTATAVAPSLAGAGAPEHGPAVARPVVAAGPLSADRAGPAAAPARTPTPRGAGVDGPLGAPVRVIDEDDGDQALLGDAVRQQSSLLAVLGIPLDIPDPLEHRDGTTLDIVSLELATLADRGGRPAALRVRIEFAELPPGAYAELSWGYEGTPCGALIAWSGNGTRIETQCRHDAVPFMIETKAQTKIPDLGPRRARSFEAVLRFDAMDDYTRSMLRPGAVLADVRATAWAPCELGESGRCGSDTAPEASRRQSYRVER